MSAPNYSNTIILGAGIIGVSTAYYLSRPPSTTLPQSIHLVDPSSPLFSSASGYAGGFLAKDWFSAPCAELGALSFELHAQLAAAHSGRERWGYSPSIATSLGRVVSGRKGRASGDASENEWLARGESRAAAASRDGKGSDDPYAEAPRWLRKRDGYKSDVISGPDNTAQCDPLRLSKFLLQECVERGVQMHSPARAISVSADLKGEIASVRIGYEDGKESDFPCSRLVITAGAWTPKVFVALFPESKISLPITSMSGYSIVIKSPLWTMEDEGKPCHAVFGIDEFGFTPEMFSRIGGEIYVAGLNDANLPLPDIATASKPHELETEKLKRVATTLLGSNCDPAELQVAREGLCFRPVTERGSPIVSLVNDDQLGGGISTRGGGEGGVFVAAGHGPWGISQSLGTGKVLSEMIEGRPTSVDVSSFSL